MKDILGWDCFDGCTCEQDGNIHHNQVRPQKPKESWWSNLFNK